MGDRDVYKRQVTCLRTVADMGFDKRRFYVDAIARDIDRLRDLNLDSADNQINQVIARLEYLSLIHI